MKKIILSLCFLVVLLLPLSAQSYVRYDPTIEERIVVLQSQVQNLTEENARLKNEVDSVLARMFSVETKVTEVISLAEQLKVLISQILVMLTNVVRLLLNS